ncbi:hypothetical protein BT69DRAFT_1246252 [Atractiella rhizophila]|nr:hypothetical protein BT69DRAFT_1246252 [Atractiella rhizophila]
MSELTPVETSSIGATSSVVENNPSDPGLSKNARKKLAKAALRETRKKEKRALEKARRKENKRKRFEAGEVLPPKAKKRKVGSQEWNGAWVVLDLGFDDKMLDKEVSSLTGQLSYCYNHSRTTEKPFRIICTGLDGRTLDRLNGTLGGQHQSWHGFQWTSESLDWLWKKDPAPSTSEPKPPDDVAKAVPRESVKFDTIPTFSQQDVVYLTADSPNILTTLDPGKAYVIGALVDHNRYKALCLNKANDLKIEHAQLPIGEYLPQLTTRKVLTVNQVLAIMLKWWETKDWKHALEAVIPSRKFEKHEASGQELEEDVDEEEAEEGNDEMGEKEEQEEGTFQTVIQL